MRRTILCIQVDGTATPYVLADYASALAKRGHRVETMERSVFVSAHAQGELPRLLCWIRDLLRPDFILSYDYWTLFPCTSEDAVYHNPFVGKYKGGLGCLFHQLGLRTVSVFGDDPFHAFGEIKSPTETFGRAIRSGLHANFVWSPVCTRRMREAGFARTELLPLGFNPDRTAMPPRTGSVPFELCFVGTHTPRRAEVLHSLVECRLGVYGDRRWREDDRFASCYQGPLPYGTNALGVYRAAPISIEVLAKDDYWLSQRSLDVWGVGGFLLSERVESVEEAFGDDLLITFEDPRELAELVMYYLQHESERIEKSKRAREIVLEKHTYENRAETLVSRLEESGFLR